MPDPTKEPAFSQALASTRQRFAEILTAHFTIEARDDRMMICYYGVPVQEIEGLTPALLEQESIAGLAHLLREMAMAYRQMVGYLFTQIEEQRRTGEPKIWDGHIDGHALHTPDESSAMAYCIHAATQLAIEDMKIYLDGVLESVQFFQILIRR